MKDVFISYSRKDSVTADRICAALDRAGISYFIDRRGIGGGMEFPEVLAQAIVGCRVFLFLASANSYKSRFTNNEVTFAFNRKPKNCLLPYIIDGSEMPLSLDFTFAGINRRNISEHPVDTVLIDDILNMLGRKRTNAGATATQRDITVAYVKDNYLYIVFAYTGKRIKLNLESLAGLSTQNLINRLNDISAAGDITPSDHFPGLAYCRQHAADTLVSADYVYLICHNTDGKAYGEAYAQKDTIKNPRLRISYASSLCAFADTCLIKAETQKVLVYGDEAVRLEAGDGVVEIQQVYTTGAPAPLSLSTLFKGIALQHCIAAGIAGNSILLDIIGFDLKLRIFDNDKLTEEIQLIDKDACIPSRSTCDIECRDFPQIRLYADDCMLRDSLAIPGNGKVSFAVDTARDIKGGFDGRHGHIDLL